MAKRTLLELTQGILSEIGSDSVNSISDTIEATSVAEIVRQVYFEIVDEHDLPVNRKLTSLEGLADTTKPTFMRIPQDVSNIKWIKYDKRQSVGASRDYEDVCYMAPDDFITTVSARPSTDTTNYKVINYDANIQIVAAKLQAPQYWTTFDDEYIIFDAYDSDVDSTLQSSKSLCYAEYRPTFTLSDTFTPDLPENLFNILYVQSLALAFANLKQTLNPKAEQRERRFRIRSQRNKWRSLRAGDQGPNFAR